MGEISVMKAPVLELPTAAAGLWRMIRDIVGDAMASLGEKPPRYQIGGGTILGARWKHRQSFDIDLTLPAETPLGRLQAEQGDSSRFVERLTALGGKPHYSAGLKLWRASFENGTRGLDIWAHDPEIGAGEEQRSIQGRVETVLSSAQILRGKLERADMRTPRDIFDITKAAAIEPEALENAVNATAVKEAERIAIDWWWNGPSIAEEAVKQLGGVAEGGQIDPARLGNAGAQAIREAIYTRCRIETKDGKIEVTTATRKRERQTRQIAADEAENAFEASGLNGYLTHAGPGAQELREYAVSECRQGRSTVILDSEPGKPIRWRTRTAGANLSPGSALPGTRPNLRPRNGERDRGNRQR